MQLYIVDWLFENAEDQIFAYNEFCKFLEEGKINKNFEELELIFIAHLPQDGTGIIICKAHDSKDLLRVLSMWRNNYSIKFNFKPAITNEELLCLQQEKCYWTDN